MTLDTQQEAGILCEFVRLRVRETVEQIEDPYKRFRAWQKWRQETNKAVDWIDIGSFGNSTYMPCFVLSMDELRKLAARWSDHPEYPRTGHDSDA